jgi:hypothetical protein
MCDFSNDILVDMNLEKTAVSEIGLDNDVYISMSILEEMYH